MDIQADAYDFYHDEDTEPPQDEDDLQRWLAKQFDDNGWYVERELESQSSEGRADIVAKHDEYGWFGVETKFFDNTGGAAFADAHHQIVKKYRNERFLGEDILAWSVCAYFPEMRRDILGDDDLLGNRAKHISKFMREAFCRHGIGYIHLDKWVTEMDFGYSNSWAKVPISYQTVDNDKPWDTGYEGRFSERKEEADAEKIRARIRRKMKEYPYR